MAIRNKKLQEVEYRNGKRDYKFRFQKAVIFGRERNLQ